ncbi:MAG: diguanylate cyclase [Myxococcota bacterium]
MVRTLSSAALTRTYVFALSAVALLALGAHGLTEWMLQEQARMAPAINMSGRQRMLSQRIGRFTRALVDAKDTRTRNRARDALREALLLFEESHEALVTGDQRLGLPSLPSLASTVYFSEKEPLDQWSRDFIEAGHAVLEAQRPSYTSSEVIRILHASHTFLLERLDDAVQAFEASAHQQTGRLRSVQLALLLLLLATLFGEALLVFRPMIQQIHNDRRALLDAHDQVDVVLEALSEAIVIFDKELRIVRLNRQAQWLWELDADEVKGRTMTELGPTVAETLSQAIRCGRFEVTLEMEGLSQSARRFPFEFRIVHVDRSDGLHFVLSGRDITARRESERRLRVYELAFQSSSDAIAICALGEGNQEHPVCFVNPAFSSTTGIGPEKVLGAPFDRMLSEDVDSELRERIQHAFEAREATRLEVPMSRPGRPDFWAEVALMPTSDSSHGTYFICMFRDVTARRERDERTKHHAYVDAVTGLPNRWSFDEHLPGFLDLARAQEAQLGVLFVDLDGFKGVNDQHGHDAGDALLREIGSRFQDAVRDGDFVARLGGDEFVVVCQDLSSVEEGAAVGQRLVETAGQSFRFRSQEAYVGASVGVAVFPDHADDPAALVRKADNAMYRAKMGGKGQVALAVEADLPTSDIAREEMEAVQALREASLRAKRPAPSS